MISEIDEIWDKKVAHVISSDYVSRSSSYEKWLEELNAEVVELHDGKDVFFQPEFWKLWSYDVVFFENLHQQRWLAILKALGGQFTSIRILVEASYVIKEVDGDRMKLEDWSHTKVDGLIAGSEFIKEQAEPFFYGQPIVVSRPDASEEMYEDLQEREYDPEAKTVSTMGYHSKLESIKGFDLLDEGVGKLEPDIREKYEFKVAGNRNPAEVKYENLNDLKTIGSDRVKNLLSESVLYIQPSRGDIWAIAAQEAMLAGVPVIVSDSVGTKKLVKEVDSELVYKTQDTEDIAETIEYFLELPPKEKKKISEEFRARAKRYSPIRQRKKFRSSVLKVLDKC